MPSLVLIRQIDPNTLLHLAVRGESTCLRDYSRDVHAPPTEYRGYSLAQIQAMLADPGNHSEKAPQHDVSDHAFWYQVITSRNDWFSLSGNAGPGQFRRLLDRFQAEVGPLVSTKNVAELQRCLGLWISNLGAVVEKDGFNHWDEDDGTAYSKPSTGIGWTSRMLEFCRERGELRNIATTNPALDFAMLSMELNLSISSTNNPIRAGITDFIKPDGLGVRSDGTFCILEVKAESDCPELFRATIQALCGAVGVYAKRDLIAGLARTSRGKRPGVTAAVIPDGAPSLGLYIMVDAKNYAFPVDPDFGDVLRLLMEAFPPLREVAYFAVDPRSPDFPEKIPVARVFTRDVG